MKALGVSAVPAEEDGWRCEIKFDGYRAIAVINAGQVRLWSRSFKALDYPEIVPPLERLRCDNAVLDGEIVALDGQGHSSFQTLQGRDLGARPPIVFYVFDLLHLDDCPLVAEPIEARQAALAKLVGKPARPLQLSPVFDVPPAVMLAEARRQGLEGIILKRHGSLYEPARRSGAWLKVKNVNEQEFVIGGYTAPRNRRQYFGALLLGYYQDGQLLYAGKVGTGFDTDLLRSLHARFSRLVASACPFAACETIPRPIRRTTTWLQPRLVAQIKFAEWTGDGCLRQPVFLGLRHDKPAKDVRREAAAVPRSGGRKS